MKLQENDKKFMQHNTITSGRFDFSACQLDIMFMLLAQLDKEFTDDRWYKIYVKDIELITGRKWNYQQLQDATEEMGSRMFSIETQEKDKDGILQLGLKQRWLFSGVDYLIGTGSFQVKINPEMKSYFFELKNNFTVLQLKSVLSCSSKHAKRLYALACQWRTAGGVVYDIGELKEMLGLKDPKGKEKEQYTEITMFKKQVLDIAKKQINENTDITFDYTLIKRGRSYSKIKIFAGTSIPKQLSIDFNKDLESQKRNAELLQKIKNITAYGVREDLAELWAVKYWKQFVEEKNKLIEEIQKGKPVEDRVKYLVGIFKKKGYV
ncbi:replication initiation protein [Flavobacterium sp.]|uniref:replication initiation protein n=1 Tax=Flavobacterium sp. TaxID=239 RepID=UPI004048E11A